MNRESCIQTIELLRQLALNIHGVIDVIDDRNCNDIINLLKEQEAIEPRYNTRTNWYECGNCHYSMTSGMHCRSELIPATKVRYCANCGFPVNWKGR